MIDFFEMYEECQTIPTSTEPILVFESFINSDFEKDMWGASNKIFF